MDFNDRAELLIGAPDTYYVTNHYVPYAFLLLRLSKMDMEALRDVLGMAYKFVTRKAATRSRVRKRRRSS